MKKINLKSKCPKCGDDDINQRFREAGEGLDTQYSYGKRAEYDLVRSCCRCCGFRWSNFPLESLEHETTRQKGGEITISAGLLFELKKGIIEAIAAFDGLDGADGTYLLGRINSLLDLPADDYFNTMKE